MRVASRREWETRRNGLLRTASLGDEDSTSNWGWIVEHETFLSSGLSHLHDALDSFALDESELAERTLDLSLRCLEKADEVDDCGTYGKFYDHVYETEELGVPMIVSECGPAPDGVEPWHDKDLGRALRARYLLTVRWLRSGERDQALLRRTVEHMQAWFDYQYSLAPDSPEAQRSSDHPDGHLRDFMQWCAEAGEWERAKQHYRAHRRRRIAVPPQNWTFTRRSEDVLYLLAAQETGERNLSDVLPEAMHRCYLTVCREVAKDLGDYFLNTESLGFAYLHAQMTGLAAEPRELLRRIREDS